MALATACGGSRFSAGAEADAETDAHETSDAATTDAGGDDTSTRVDSGGREATALEAGFADVSNDDASNPGDAVADTVTEGAPGNDAAEACSPILYFLDGDGDGYGGTSTSMGCAPPTSGSWVTSGGDCDDSNPTVNPGQTAYFAAGYLPPGATRVSFDYDCDGAERESGGPPKASCQYVDLSCVGSGYLEASPRGAEPASTRSVAASRP